MRALRRAGAVGVTARGSADTELRALAVVLALMAVAIVALVATGHRPPRSRRQLDDDLREVEHRLDALEGRGG